MTRWERFKNGAAGGLAFAVLLGIIVGSLVYFVAKEVQWWRTSRARWSAAHDHAYCWWCRQAPICSTEGNDDVLGKSVTFTHDCPVLKAHLQRLADVHAENNKRFDRIRNALAVAMRFGGIEGEHHRTWVIDQMVRALTGCAMLVELDDLDAPPSLVDPSVPPPPEYEAWVAEHNAGEDGAETYTWETGIAP